MQFTPGVWILLMASLVLSLGQHPLASSGATPGSEGGGASSPPRSSDAALARPGSRSDGLYELQPFVSNITGSLLVHLPPLNPGASPNRFLFVARPDGSVLKGKGNSSAVVDLGTGKVTYLHILVPSFCSAPVLMPDGRAALAGSYEEPGYRTIQMFDPRVDSYSLAGGNTTFMNYPRYYPSAHMRRDGKVTIIGGTLISDETKTAGPPEAEVWDSLDPDKAPVPRPNPSLDFINYTFPGWYPFVSTLPNGRALIWGNDAGVIYDEALERELLRLPARPTGAPSGLHPFTAGVTLTALQPPAHTRGRYEFSLMVFGGSATQLKHRNNNTRLASSLSYRLDMWECGEEDGAAANAGICTGEWQVEDMLGTPRVMADTLLLPNGRVIIANGAKAGNAGFIGWPPVSGTAGYPATTALYYDPYKPLGQRFSALATTTIARLYHSTLCLEQGGAALVAGSETSRNYPGEDDPSLSLPPSLYESRLELLYPPEIVPGAERPAIVHAPQKLAYAQPLTVAFTYAGGSRRVAYGALAAPCAGTHNRRMGHSGAVYRLQVASEAAATSLSSITLLAPPEGSGAVPGWYLLFLVDEAGVYSRGVWVQLLWELPAAAPSDSSAAAAAAAPNGTSVAAGPASGVSSSGNVEGAGSSGSHQGWSQGMAMVAGAAMACAAMLVLALAVHATRWMLERHRPLGGSGRTGGRSSSGDKRACVGLATFMAPSGSKWLDQEQNGGQEEESVPLKHGQRMEV